MYGLGSALLAMMFTSVTWLAKSGVVVGSLLGASLAYLLIGRVLLAQGRAPQRSTVRRFAAACCLLWALVLPLSFGAAGLLWGLARGLGDVVEPTVATTAPETTQTWLGRANGLSGGALGRFAKRLSDGEVAAAFAERPTLEETIKTSVAAYLFQDAAAQIRAMAGHYVRALLLGAVALASVPAGMLRLMWKPPAAPSNETKDPSAGARG